MRVILVVLFLALSAPAASASAWWPGGECGRGPWETVWTVDVMCCAWGEPQFYCFIGCDVWVRDPVLGGFHCVNVLGSALS